MKNRIKPNNDSATALQLEMLEPRLMMSADLGLDLNQVEIVHFDAQTQVESRLSLEHLNAELFQANSPGFEGTLDQLKSPAGIGTDPLQTVFGGDQRVLINNTTDDPFRKHGALRMKFNDGTTNGVWSYCSGTMVGPFHFLTAGHCVFDNRFSWGWVTEAEVALGRDGDERWFGVAEVTDFYSPNEWVNNADWTYDWALLTLDRNIGSFTGWEGYAAYSTNTLNGMNVSIEGYPSDLAGNDNQTLRADDLHQPFMYQSTGNMLNPTARQLLYNGTLDTAGGMSGSGVMFDDPSLGRVVTGVHAYGDGGDGTNRATRMLSYMVDTINFGKANAAVPTDRPDLVDWDTWFHTDVSSMNTARVRPGDSFSITTYPRNNGTAISGAYTVSFYASTNDYISSADYFLGSVSMNSLSSFNWDTAKLDIAFPDNIPARDYYVGWIIDSSSNVTEFDEGNNKGTIDGMLSVVDPLPEVWSGSAEGNAYFINGSSFLGSDNVNDTLSFDAFLNSNTDVDSYYFAVEKSGTYEFRAGDFASTAVDPMIAVYDADTGARLGVDDDSGAGDDALLSLNLNGWHRYIVAVSDNFHNGTGDVDIQILGSGSPTGSSVITLDQFGDANLNGLINNNADTDYYLLTAPSTSLGNGSITLTPESGLDVTAVLWDADGNLIARSESAGPGETESIDLSGVAPLSEYRLSVVSNDYASNGSFSLAVDLEVADSILMESGSINNLDHNWQTISLAKTYVDPIVILSPLSHNGSDPSIVRVSNVTSNSFDVQVREWNYLDGTHIAESIRYLVVERGTYTLADGSTLIADSASVDHNWRSIQFGTPLSTSPIVVSTVASAVGSDVVTTRTQRADEDGFQIRVQEEEGNNDWHVLETVNYLVMQPGIRTIGGKTFEAGLTPNSVTQNAYTLGFNHSFAEAPVFLASMQTYDGSDPAALRLKGLTSNSATFFVEEERSGDPEIWHTTEAIGYIAFTSSSSTPYEMVGGQNPSKIHLTANRPRMGSYQLDLASISLEQRRDDSQQGDLNERGNPADIQPMVFDVDRLGQLESKPAANRSSLDSMIEFSDEVATVTGRVKSSEVLSIPMDLLNIKFVDA